MKIVAISDIHGTLHNPKDNDFWPEGDVLCICGDIMPLDIQRDTIESIVWLVTDFFNWVRELKYDHVLLIAGNHDFVFQTLSVDKNGNHRKPKRVMKKLSAPTKLILLEDSGCVIADKTFYGTPWCPKLSNWAYYADSEKLTQKFDKIPDNVDVLLTHCPPKVELYGTVLETGWNHMNDFGCQELAEAILKKKPKLSIFGHVHSGDHRVRHLGDTIYANVSAKDEGYEYRRMPTVIEI